MKKRLLVVALNEFNKELLEEVAERYSLPNIKRILDLNVVETHAPDLYESRYLEPWCQWVSIHTGTPAASHKIRNLGDVPNLGEKQLWESLSDSGITSGVWSALNARMGEAPNCKFFLPDPWTFSETATPKELNRVLNFPRFVAKNRLSPYKPKAFSTFMSFLLPFIRRPKMVGKLIRMAPRVLKRLVATPEPYVLFAITEYFSTQLFIEYKRRFDPQFSIIYLNTLAHIQHYYWQKDSIPENERFRYGFGLVDEMLGCLLDQRQPGEDIVVLNAMQQANSNDEPNWSGYRPIDQTQFLDSIGIRPARIEELMTIEAHLFFDKELECDLACQKLNDITVDGKPFFFVEKDKHNPCKFFYRTDYFADIPNTAVLKYENGEFPFFDYFKSLGVRTGYHQQIGHAITSLDWPQETFVNYELFDRIHEFFKVDPSLNRSPSELPAV